MMKTSARAYVKKRPIRAERVVLSALLFGVMSSPSWAEEMPQSPGGGSASELSRELGIEDPGEAGEIGSRAVKSPPNPAVMPQKLQGAMPPRAWDALWAVSWKRANSYYRIQAAPTTMHDPMCRNPLTLDVFVRDTIQAIAIRKYGDAARFMSQFQDRSLCLTREGVRGVEFALSFYLHHALISLPPQQAKAAVQGVVNLGMLTFDQLQYTRRSWWLLTIMSHARMIGPHMVDYPRADLGAWFYDSRPGLMLKSRFPDALDRLIGAMRRVENFGNGTCAIIDMSEEGFTCQDDWTGIGAAPGMTTGKTGSKTDKFPRMAGTIPPNTATCVLQSVQQAGVRGTMACMSKAMAGYTYNPRMGLQDKTIPDTSQAGIRDKMCALGEEAGGDGGGATNAADKAAEAKEPSTWDKFKEGVSKVADAVKDGAEKAWDFVKDVFDTTPPVIGELGQGASKEGADAERGFLQMMQEQKARDSLLKDDGADRYYQDRENRVVTDPQWDKGRVAGDGIGVDGGKCSAKSNAAARAKSLYQCIDQPAAPNRYANPSPENMQPGGQQPPPSGEKRYGILGDQLVEAHSSTKAGGVTKGGTPQESGGGPPPTLDPNLIYVDPMLEQMAGQNPSSSQPTGPMACMMQAGDLVRASLNDPRCNSLKRCVGNQPCPCDRQAPPSGMQPEKFGNPSKPNCADGQCDKPDPMGTPNPPPKPTFNFGGPPAPAPPGPTPGSAPR
jgi:hypothetical protein